jgi:ATP-dependent RNA helicase SUPV3L1/SUV3
MEQCPALPPVTEAGPATDAAAETVSAEARESAPDETAAPDAMPEKEGPAPDSAGAPDAGSVVEPVPTADAGLSEVTATPTEAVALVVEETPPATLPPDLAVLPASDAAEPADVAKNEPAAVDAVSEPEGAASAEIAADVAPATVEVWRPGGRSADRRPRHDRNRHRRQQFGRDGAQPAAADGEAGEGAQGRERHKRGRRRPSADVAAEGASAGSERAPGREPREGKDRPSRERFQGKSKNKDRDRDQDKGRFQGSRKGGREGRQDAGPSHRPYASSAPRERERPMDPNSPFAKLAALKEQLAGRKD